MGTGEAIVVAEGSPAEVIPGPLLEPVYDFPIAVHTIDDVGRYAIYCR